MMATLLFHECPLIVMVTAGRLPPPSAATTSAGTSRPAWALGARRANGTSSPAPATLCRRAVQVRCAAGLTAVRPPARTRLSPPPPRGPRSAQHRLLLGVGLVLSLGAVADVPDVAVRVGERSAVPAPLQLRRGLEDLPAGVLGLVQNFVDAVLAAHDVIEHDAAEAAALRAHAHHAGEPGAAVEADQRTAVGNEEHRDLVVVLDLPAQPFGVEPPGPVHVLDTEEDRTHVRFHALFPLIPGGDAHDRHAKCGPVTGASRFLIRTLPACQGPLGRAPRLLLSGLQPSRAFNGRAPLFKGAPKTIRLMSTPGYRLSDRTSPRPRGEGDRGAGCRT